MGYNVPTLDEIIAALQKRIRAMEVIIFSNVGTVVVTTPLDIPSLSAAVTYYTDPNSRLPRADVTWTWQAPAAPDPDALDADPAVDYMFGCQLSTDANAPVVFSSTKGALTANVKNLPVDISVVGKVYAVSQRGATGPIKQVVTAISHDTTPPPQTSTPVVTAGLKSVTVTYDGKDVSNNAMPLDYSMVRVYKGSVDNFNVATQGTLVDTIVGAGSLYIPANDNYDRIYVRLVPVDSSGNVGAIPSTTAYADPGRTTATELGVVLPGNIGFTDTGNLVIDGSFENATMRNNRTSLLPAGFAFDSTAGISFVGDYTLKIGVITGSPTMYLHVLGNNNFNAVAVLPAKKYLVFAMVRGISSNGSLSLVARFTNQDNSTTTSTVVTTNTWDGSWDPIQGVVQVPDNAKYMELAVQAAGNTAGAIYVDAVQVKEVITSMLIEDAAITRAKIAAAAIGTAQIEEVDAGLIKSGFIAGERIKAGSITTGMIAIGAVTQSVVDPSLGSQLNIASNPSVTDKATAASVTNLSNSVTSLNTDMTTMKNSVVIDGTGVRISKQGSPFQITIDNDSLDFLSGQTTVAYINGQKMYISAAEILQQLIIGVHTFEKYDANTTFVRWVG